NALNNLPAPVRDAIVKMNDHIVQMNQALLRDADLTPDLKQAIAKNIGTYIHRSYQIFEDNDLWKKRLLSAQERGDTELIRIMNDARSLFRSYIIKEKTHDHALAMLKAGTPVTRAQAIAFANSLNIDHDVENMLNDYINIGDDPIAGRISLMGGKRPGALGQAIMQERGQINPVIRKLWGEWDDPVVNFVKSYTALGAYSENDRFQRRVLTDGLDQGYIWKEGVSAGTRPVGWVPIVSEGSKSMKVLAGAYGPPLLRSAFSVMDSPAHKSGFENYLFQAMALPLAAKTVGSTGSAVRNFLGNLAFVYGNGNFIGPYGKAFQAAYAEAAKGGPQAMQDYVLKLTRLGVFGDNVDVNMVKKIMQAKTGEGSDTIIDNLISKLPKEAQGPVRAFTGFFPSFYTAADSYWKAYGFEADLGKRKWAHADELEALSGPVKDARISELEQQA